LAERLHHPINSRISVRLMKRKAGYEAEIERSLICCCAPGKEPNNREVIRTIQFPHCPIAQEYLLRTS
jgi:hypothetical protein